jgi:hypothetical protein
MGHPFAAHKQHLVERKRVGHITKGYASGGAVSAADEGGQPSAKATRQRDALAVTGKPARERLDKPCRARGGRAPKAKGTNVNVIIAPQGGQSPQPPNAPPPGLPPIPPGQAAAPPPMPMRPPMPMPPGAAPPGAMPPGGPIRSAGGRAYAKGGAVKKRADGGEVGWKERFVGRGKLRDEMGGKPPPMGFDFTRSKTQAEDTMRGQMQRAEDVSDAVPRRPEGRAKGGRVFNAGVHAGTSVQHTDGKMDQRNVGRGKVVTYKTGGAVFAPPTGKMAPKFEGGAGGGEARIAKAHRAAKHYARA